MTQDQLDAAPVSGKSLEDYLNETSSSSCGGSSSSRSGSSSSSSSGSDEYEPKLIVSSPEPNQLPAVKKRLAWWEADEESGDSKTSSTVPDRAAGTASELDQWLEPEAPQKSFEERLKEQHVVVVKKHVSYAGKSFEMTQQLEKGTEAEKQHRIAASKQSHLQEVLTTIKGGNAVNTLVKSRHDWNVNKKVVGDADELKAKAKNGVLDKLEFLNKADYNQFLRERDARNAKRKLQGGSLED